MGRAELIPVRDVEFFQPAGCDVVGRPYGSAYCTIRTGKEEIEAGGEIRESPEVTADDPADPVLGQRGAIGEHELHMRLERFAGQRTGWRGERMISRDHWPHDDSGHEFGVRGRQGRLAKP